MAASIDSLLHHSPSFPSGLPPAADKLVQRLLFVFADFFDSPTGFGNQIPHHGLCKNSGNVLKNPELSIQGFVALLLGVSSTLILFGSCAFLLGFIVVLLILPASIVVYISGYLSSFNKGPHTFSASFASVCNNKTLQRGLWCKQ